MLFGRQFQVTVTAAVNRNVLVSKHPYGLDSADLVLSPATTVQQLPVCEADMAQDDVYNDVFCF